MKVQDRIKAIRLMQRLSNDNELSKYISVRLVEKEKQKNSKNFEKVRKNS